jgi:hypothetical protein
LANVGDFGKEREDEKIDDSLNATVASKTAEGVKAAVAGNTSESGNSLLSTKLLNGKKTPVVRRSSV